MTNKPQGIGGGQRVESRQDTDWEEILRQIVPPIAGAAVDPWQSAAEQVRQTDARQLLEGHGCQGQGE